MIEPEAMPSSGPPFLRLKAIKKRTGFPKEDKATRFFYWLNFDFILIIFMLLIGTLVTSSVQAAPPLPTCSINVSITTGDAPLTVDFTAITTGRIRKYWWNFGDGTGAKDVSSVSHAYQIPGEYTVTLSVRDKDGNTASAEPVLITVTGEPPPPVSIDATSQVGEAPLTVDFNAVVIGTPPIRRYWWNFGDGTSATDVSSISHTYEMPGEYTVTLSIRDLNGTVYIAEPVLITVTTSPYNLPPTLTPIGDREGTEGEWFIISRVTATDPNGDILTMQLENKAPGMRFFETDSRPGYVEYKLRWPDKFVKIGTYDVTFVVSDGELIDSETITITISSSSQPSGSILINNGEQEAYTYKVLLSLSVDQASDITEMSFSNDNITYSQAEPFAEQKTWSLNLGNNQEKTVYVKFKNTSGIWSEPVFDTIYLNRPESQAEKNAYLHVFESMDRYKTGDELRLIESYTHPYPPGQELYAWVYDNTLSIIMLLARHSYEDVKRAKILSEALIFCKDNDPKADGRIRNAYYADDIADVSNQPRIKNSSTFCGNMAWAITGLMHYYKLRT